MYLVSPLEEEEEEELDVSPVDEVVGLAAAIATDEKTGVEVGSAAELVGRATIAEEAALEV